MLQQTVLGERITSSRMHASCLPVWVPHQLPALQVFGQTLAPLRVPIPCALLRVHQRSASEPVPVQHRYPDNAVEAVVAEWNTCPQRVALPLGGDEDDLPLRPCGGSSDVGSAAPPSSVAYPFQWVVLRVRQASHKCTAVGIESCRSVDEGSCGSCQQLRDRRLRLGTVLYASDWEFLVSRQERKTTTTECSSAVGVTTSSTGERTVSADMEALSIFFPALHHGRYYATVQAFVRHCRYSDEHLVWCETDPLVSVEWVGAEEAQTEAATCQGARSLMLKECDTAAVECTSTVAREDAGTWCSRVGGSRKRRRRWLSQRARECPSRRTLQVEVPPCAHHQSTEATTFSCSISIPVATNATALDSVCCAYFLSLKPPLGRLYASGEEPVPTAAAATADSQGKCCNPSNASPPPSIPRDHTEETLQSSSYASWYLALRPACRSALHVSHSAAAVMKGAEEAGGEATRHRALQEVFLHGVAASLALWFCKHGKCSSASASVNVCEPRSSELSPTLSTASTADTVVLVAALLRDWWDQLSQEAAQSFAVSATAARAGPERRRSRCHIAYQVWASLQTWGRASNELTYAAVAPPPAPLERLCVACAIVVTFMYRRQEQIKWRDVSPTIKQSHEASDKANDDDVSADDWVVPSESNGGAAHSGGRVPSIGGVASNTLYTSASCRVTRMSVKDSRRWHDDYRSCMDLVLHLLFAEQRQHWTK